MTDYKARVKCLLRGQFSGEEAIRAVILDMVSDGIPESDAERLIVGILSDVFDCDDWLDFVNDYRELRLRKGEGCPTKMPELPVDFPDPMNIMQFEHNRGMILWNQ